MVGVPWLRNLREYQWCEARRSCESETERLARCLVELGNPGLKDASNWSLGVTAAERERARVAVAPAITDAGLIVCLVGASVDVKDLGVPNWSAAVSALNQVAGSYGLAFVGAAGVFDKAETVRSY